MGRVECHTVGEGLSKEKVPEGGVGELLLPGGVPLAGDEQGKALALVRHISSGVGGPASKSRISM